MIVRLTRSGDLGLTRDTHSVYNPVVNLFKMALQTYNHLVAR